MFKKFKISCDEATTICDKSQYKEASLLEKVKLQIHVLFCKVCRMYQKQNKTLTKVYQYKAKEEKKQDYCLHVEEKKQLKKQINKLSS